MLYEPDRHIAKQLPKATSVTSDAIRAGSSSGASHKFFSASLQIIKQWLGYICGEQSMLLLVTLKINCHL
jgi:hypothetical protein